MWQPTKLFTRKFLAPQQKFTDMQWAYGTAGGMGAMTNEKLEMGGTERKGAKYFQQLFAYTLLLPQLNDGFAGHFFSSRLRVSYEAIPTMLHKAGTAISSTRPQIYPARPFAVQFPFP